MPLLKDCVIWSAIRFDYYNELLEYDGFNYTMISRFAGSEKYPELAWGVAYAAPGKQVFAVHLVENYLPGQRMW